MALIHFNTSNSTFRQLFGNGLSYHVPRFQRDYSWSENEWDELWQDILQLQDSGDASAHYMGYLVLQTSDSKKFTIIDGQQRMTTISVMILAALKRFESLAAAEVDAQPNTQRKEQFRSSYIGYTNPVDLQSHPKLQLNRNNDRFYQSCLVPLEKLPQRGLNASELLLHKAFCWFEEKFAERFGKESDSGKRLARFVDDLVDRVFFTVITVGNELNAYKVFEALNARGVRLSSTDLLKNHLFSLIFQQKIHESVLDEWEDHWNEIIGMLGEGNFPEFLRVFWNSRHKLVRQSELYKTISREIRSRDDAATLIYKLRVAAEIYVALKDPEDKRWKPKEKAALEQLKMFSVRLPLAMLLSCYERFFESNRESMTQIMKTVAILSFRYHVICGYKATDLESLYNGIAQKVCNGTYSRATEVTAALETVYPNDTRFLVLFSEKQLTTANSPRNRKIMRYILFELERQNSRQEFNSESDTYSLEHILPQQPSPKWAASIEESQQAQLIHRIGNMTLLKTQKNRNLGNADYAEKRTLYADSDFQITRAIAEHYETWDEQKINARQREMGKIAKDIWRIDF